LAALTTVNSSGKTLIRATTTQAKPNGIPKSFTKNIHSCENLSARIQTNQRSHIIETMFTHIGKTSNIHRSSSSNIFFFKTFFLEISLKKCTWVFV